MANRIKDDATVGEKLVAIGFLLMEMLLVAVSLSVVVVVLNIFGLLAAQFVFGYSWSWVKGHFDDLLLFGLIAVTPILLLGGMAWIAMQDEYKRILCKRKRKW